MHIQGSMAPTELLLLNGAKVDQRDLRGRSALHHATMLGNTGYVHVQNADPLIFRLSLGILKLPLDSVRFLQPSGRTSGKNTQLVITKFLCHCK